MLAACEHVPWLQRTISILNKAVPRTHSPNLTRKRPALTRRRGRSQEVERRHAVDSHTARQRSAVPFEPAYVIDARVVENVIAGQDDDELRNERFAADAAAATYRRLRR